MRELHDELIFVYNFHHHAFNYLTQTKHRTFLQSLNIFTITIENLALQIYICSHCSPKPLPNSNHNIYASPKTCFCFYKPMRRLRLSTIAPVNFDALTTCVRIIHHSFPTELKNTRPSHVRRGIAAV